jgi:hypothetical protein
LAKIGKNWQKLAKIGKNWQKLAKIGKNWQKLAKIGKIGKNWQKLACSLKNQSDDNFLAKASSILSEKMQFVFQKYF